MSVADLLEERFESDAIRGVLSVSGVIGTWAGPRSPGTGVRDGAPQDRRRRRRSARRVGLPRGRHGRRHRRRCAPPRESLRRDDPHRRRGRPDRSSTTAGSRGVVLGDRRGARRRHRRRHDASADHVPQARSSAPTSPTTSSLAIERWKSRSGTVKVNLALDRLPDVHAASPASIPRSTAARSCSRSRSTTSRARSRTRSPAARRASRSPTSASRRCSIRRSRRPGKHVMSMFTQWVPHACAAAPHTAELDAYADRVIARIEARRARLHVVDPAPPGHRPARDGRRRTAWSAATSSTASCRRTSCSTCVPRPATPTSDADRRPLPGVVGDPWRRWGHRHPRAAGREEAAQAAALTPSAPRPLGQDAQCAHQWGRTHSCTSSAFHDALPLRSSTGSMWCPDLGQDAQYAHEWVGPH